MNGMYRIIEEQITIACNTKGEFRKNGTIVLQNVPPAAGKSETAREKLPIFGVSEVVEGCLSYNW
jgi:hypothetical protein